MRCVLTKFLVVCLCLTTTASAFEGWRPLPTGGVTRIAFGSCAKQWESQPIWHTVAETRPDLFLFIGDAIYGDWHGKQPFTPSETTLRKDWTQLAVKPEFIEVRKKVPFMATWDNHDYGSHNGGADFVLKGMTKKLFLDFFGEPPDSDRRRTPGIYDAKIFGPEGKRVQIILLDTRWFRSKFKLDPRSSEERAAIGKVGKYMPHDDASTTILGDAQWQWLEEQLRQPAEIRLIVSSTQIIPDQKGMDEWGAFPHERDRLFRLIQTTDADRVILLSGNVHFSELSRLEVGGHPLYEFTASGMTHVNTTYAGAPNRFRAAGPYVDLNVGLIEINWYTKPGPEVVLKALGLNGEVGYRKTISLSS